jgi:hypothetical protein
MDMFTIRFISTVKVLLLILVGIVPVGEAIGETVVVLLRKQALTFRRS